MTPPAATLDPPTPASGLPAMVRRAGRSFLPSSLPLMARANYRREAASAFFIPFALAATEGSIVSVLVRLSFEGRVNPLLLNLAVGVLAAAPAMANIFSFAWVRASHGVRKIPFINGLQIGVLALVLAIALAPTNGPGLVVTTLAVVAARMCWSGLITIRSTVWRYNYPRDLRARITGKFATIQVLMIALLSLGLGQAMDANEIAFRVLLPVGVVLAGVGVWQYSRVRMRGEATLLRGERTGEAARAASLNPWSIVRTLREDRPFGRFMAAQFLLGTGNMMSMAPLVLILREDFGLGYLGSLLITASIPMAVMPLAIPFWARLLDHTHIVRFRTIHSWAFLVSLGLILVGILLDAPWLLFLGAIAKGVAFGGGVLAWNLGHLDFAPAGRESQYMGVHVTLTGVRGALAPMIGVTIYTMASGVGFAGSAGAWTYGLCLLIAAAGTASFFVLARDPAIQDRIRSEPIEPAPPSRTVP